MKKFLFLLTLTFLFASCEDVQSSNLNDPQSISVDTEVICKDVIAKDNPIENRFSTTDFFLGEGSVTKSQTVFYLYFEGNYFMEVDNSTYNMVKIDSPFCAARYRFRHHYDRYNLKTSRKY